MHKRTAFLNSLKNQLKTLSGFGGVWIQRNTPVRNSFPSITLFVESELSNRQTINPIMCLARQMTVKIVIWIRGTQDDEKLEFDFDNAAELIEKKLIAPSGCDDFFLIGTDFQFLEEEPEINAVTLTYMLEYSALEGNPSI